MNFLFGAKGLFSRANFFCSREGSCVSKSSVSMHAPHSRVPIVQWFSGCEGVCFSVDAHMIPMPHAACAQRCQIPVHWALKWPQMQGKIAPMFFVTTLPFFPTLLESYHSHQESVNFLVVIHFKVAHFADMGKMCVIKCECVCLFFP